MRDKHFFEHALISNILFTLCDATDGAVVGSKKSAILELIVRLSLSFTLIFKYSNQLRESVNHADTPLLKGCGVGFYNVLFNKISTLS